MLTKFIKKQTFFIFSKSKINDDTKKCNIILFYILETYQTITCLLNQKTIFKIK
jgi:hypothetical protein